MRKTVLLLALVAAVVGYLAYPSAQHYWAVRQLREKEIDLRIPDGLDAQTARVLEARKYVGAGCAATQEILALLMKTRFDVNSRNEEGLTVLHCMAARGWLEQVRMLLDGGAEPSPRADLGRQGTGHADLTPMHLAAAWHHLDVVELLRSRGADINEACGAGTPLMIALAVRGKDRFAAPQGRLPHTPDLLSAWQTFRKLGARVDSKDGQGNSLLHVAMRAGQRPLIEAMLASGEFDLNRPNDAGETPFMTFIGYGVFVQSSDGSAYSTTDVDLIERMIEQGADVNARNKLGYTVILGATWQPDLFDLLSRHGADVFVAQSGGQSIWSELRNAESGRIIAFAEKLPRLSVPIEKNGKPGNGPLHVFARESRPDLVEYFLKRGASPNEVNDAGNTPLHEAFEIPMGGPPGEGRNAEVIRILLAAGADPNARNAVNMTPLMKAARQPAEVLQTLIAKGADVNAVARQNGNERHVLDYFSESHNLQGLRLLVTAGAKKTGAHSANALVDDRTGNPAVSRSR